MSSISTLRPPSSPLRVLVCCAVSLISVAAPVARGSASPGASASAASGARVSASPGIYSTAPSEIPAALRLQMPRMTASAPDSATGAIGNDPRAGRIRRVSPAWILVEAGLMATDETTDKWLDPDLGHAHRRVGFAQSLTRLGDPSIFMIPALGLYFSGTKNRRSALETATAVADASIITFVLKDLVGKERPEQSGGKVRFHGPGTKYESFPSGHSTAAWAGATVLGDRYPKLKLLFYALATGVSWSRVRLSKHFLSDVAAGAAIGVASGTRVAHRGHGFLDFRF